MSNFTKIALVTIVLFSCNNTQKVSDISTSIPEGMVWVESKSFLMGGKDSDNDAMMRERPSHNVIVDGFFIDISEVTNKQFREFVEATNYITDAEREIDWVEIKRVSMNINNFKLLWLLEFLIASITQ